MVVNQSAEEIDKHISQRIFFTMDDKFKEFSKTIRNKETISVESALIIAYNWRELTRTYLFTTIMGFGKLAENILEKNAYEEARVRVLQSSFSIIDDDLNNTDNLFSNIAPKGFKGVHYKWWEESILDKLSASCPLEVQLKLKIIGVSTRQLLKGMAELTKDYLGSAVQLRVVEAIARDIVLCFIKLFSKVQLKGQLVFSDKKELSWISSHIKAEIIHHRKVIDKGEGMIYVAQRIEEQEKFGRLIDWYTALWADVIKEFEEWIREYGPSNHNN